MGEEIPAQEKRRQGTQRTSEGRNRRVPVCVEMIEKRIIHRLRKGLTQDKMQSMGENTHL